MKKFVVVSCVRCVKIISFSSKQKSFGTGMYNILLNGAYFNK